MLIDVKNVSLSPVDLQTGALVSPGQIARGVPDNDPLIRSYLNVGALLPVPPLKPARKTTSKKEPQS